MKNKSSYIAVGVLLTIMAVLAISSVWNDSAIMDEASHIPAGYSYITQQDMRINPEHPPLVKSLSGLSAFLYSKISGNPINFDTTTASWNNEINSQWSFGFNFLYGIDNDADNIIFWSRIPAILIMLLLGFYIFKWTREIYGNRAGVFALFFYALSPTVLTHGRFVTTDVSAAAGIFISTYYFIKALKVPTRKNIIIAGVVLGLALLLKFSTFLLVPFFVLMTILYAVSKCRFGGSRVVSCKSLVVSLLLVLVIGAATLYPIYQFSVWNYPAAPQTQEEKDTILAASYCGDLDLAKYPVSQFRDTECILKSYGGGESKIADLVVWMSDKPILRSYGQYMLGLLMVSQRAVGGNTTYFLGEISAAGWKTYFPMVYLIKIPLAFHVFTIIAVAYALLQILFVRARTSRFGISRFMNWIRKKPSKAAMLLFIAIYWLITLRSTLNIGIRHILPTLPLIYVLVSGNVSQFLVRARATSRGFYVVSCSLLVVCLAWYAYANLSVFPSYLTYFNESVGGSEKGHEYVVDSNLDWGQDLKRLAIWAEENDVDKIKLEYFGGGGATYYLGDKFEPWWGKRPKEEAYGSWLAVSGTLLQNGRGEPAHGFDQSTTHYKWLDAHEPTVIIGNSIFVYDLTGI